MKYPGWVLDMFVIIGLHSTRNFMIKDVQYSTGAYNRIIALGFSDKDAQQGYTWFYETCTGFMKLNSNSKNNTSHYFFLPSTENFFGVAGMTYLLRQHKKHHWPAPCLYFIINQLQGIDITHIHLIQLMHFIQLLLRYAVRDTNMKEHTMYHVPLMIQPDIDSHIDNFSSV